MQREEFETRIRELLPGSSEIALATVTTYAEEPDELAIELSDGAGHFYDAFYVNLALVRRDYGEDIAQSIFNHGERYLFYPSELRAVARLVASGSSMEQIMDCIETFGCVVTNAESAESQEILSRFQNGEREILALPFPPRSQRPAAWKWGEALSLFLILWRPLLWTTSSTGFMARW